MKRLVIGFLAGVIVTLLVVGPVQGGAHNCKPAWKCAPPTAAPTTVQSPTPTVAPTVSPTSAPTLTFDDEFEGTALAPVWAQHFTCCGTVTMDPSTTTVSGGVLRMTAVDRGGTWFADVIDTKTSFTQTYGYFEARVKIPAGKGLWPAFWSYLAGSSELDTMEVCANPSGTNGGNDVGLLHTTIHFADGSSSGHDYRTADLSTAFHVYAEDWRPGRVTFYLDGAAVWTYSGAKVPSTPQALLFDLGVGGSWCSAPDSTTPNPAEMQVDYVRVQP